MSTTTKRPETYRLAMDYRARGFFPVPVPVRSKDPGALLGKGWNKKALAFTEADIDRWFGSQPRNIGLLLGPDAGGLLDIDVDAATARRIAGRFIVTTEAYFGRKTAPASHYLYICEDAPPKTTQWEGVDKKTIIELRSGLQQSIAPGSIHEDTGEPITWHDHGEPARVDADDLRHACIMIAVTTVLIDAWPDGSRHDASLALAGGLKSAGVSMDDAKRIEAAIAHETNAEDPEVKLANVEGTYARDTDAETTGWPRLAKLLGDEPVNLIREWLGCDQFEAKDNTPTPDIVPFEAEDLPALDRAPLPEWAAKYADAVTRANETPPAMANLFAVAALAASCQRRYVVEPEPGYREVLVQHTACALPSGERKSQTVAKMFAPIREVERELAKDAEDEIIRATALRKLAESELRKLQRDYEKAADQATKDKLAEEVVEATKQLPDVPSIPQIVMDDFTEAALGVALVQNHESLVVVSDEGGLFDNLAGRHKDTAELDLFLKSHTGGHHTVNRTSRAAVFLRRPLLSVAIAPQPGVIQRVGAKPEFIDRGLTARFLWALPEPRVGTRSLDPKRIDPAIAGTYHATLAAMAKHDRTHKGDPTPLYFDDHGYEAWKTFQRSLEPRMGKGGDLAGVKPWASKLAGAVARLAATHHVGKHAGRGHYNAGEETIGIESVAVGVAFACDLIPHAIAVHRLMGGGGQSVASLVAERFNADGWLKGPRPLTDWWRPCRDLVGETSSCFLPIGETLADHGYLIECEPPKGRRGGHKSRWYRANPKLNGGGS